MTRVLLMTCPLITCPLVPAGMRAEQDIGLPWQLYLLIVLTRRVLVSTALLKALVKGVQVVAPLSPPPPPTPFAPGSPYDALPGM